MDTTDIKPFLNKNLAKQNNKKQLNSEMFPILESLHYIHS